MKQFLDDITDSQFGGYFTSSQRLARLKARRRLWLKVHLYLGLFAGAVLVVIGLTGSILVFYNEIDAALNPQLYMATITHKTTDGYHPLSEMIASAQVSIPKGSKLLDISYPIKPGTNFKISFLPPNVIPGEYAYLNVFVDPYSGKVAGTRVFYDASNPFNNCLVGFILKLHYNLLLGDTPGMTVVGVIAVLLIISVLTGLIVWWPLTGRWLQALSFKRHASTERFNFDLHKTTGFYTSLVLFVVLLSGIYFNLYDQFLWLVERFSPATRITQLTSNSLKAGAVISVESAIASAWQHFSDGKLQSITVPPDEKGAYRICWQDVKSLSIYVINWRCVGVDQYSGEVTDVIDPQHGTAGDVFLQWQWPLHSGRAFGWAGRILVFISGLACPVLFVTGIIRWVQKRRAARKKTS